MNANIRHYFMAVGVTVSAQASFGIPGIYKMPNHLFSATRPLHLTTTS